MDLDHDEKTEQPTARRRRLAHEQGLGPRSADLSFACRLLGIAAALQFFGSGLVTSLSESLADAFQNASIQPLSVNSIVGQLWDMTWQVAASVLAMVGCVWAGCLIAHFLQVGLRFEPTNLIPDFSRLNPMNGLVRILRIENLRQAAWMLTKFAAVTAAGGWYLWTQLGQMAGLTECDPATVAAVVAHHVTLLSWQLASLFLAFGLIDFGYQYWRFEQSLKMSPEELREELRSDGGNRRWKRQPAAKQPSPAV